MTKPTTFRPSEKTNTIIDNYMKTNKLTSRNQAIIQIIEDFAIQSEELPKGTHEQWRQIGCKALLQFDYKNMIYHCAIKAPKTTVIPSLKICEFCWARQQAQKTQKVPETSIPKIYKKPEKIYCLGLTRWVDPDKIQAMCYRCKTQTLTRYVECQQKQRLP